MINPEWVAVLKKHGINTDASIEELLDSLPNGVVYEYYPGRTYYFSLEKGEANIWCMYLSPSRFTGIIDPAFSYTGYSQRHVLLATLYYLFTTRAKITYV